MLLKLLISLSKPHNAVTTSNMSRWLKETLRLSGIGIAIYCSHSVQGATISAARSMNVPIEEILSDTGCMEARSGQN